MKLGFLGALWPPPFCFARKGAVVNHREHRAYSRRVAYFQKRSKDVPRARWRTTALRISRVPGRPFLRKSTLGAYNEQSEAPTCGATVRTHAIRVGITSNDVMIGLVVVGVAFTVAYLVSELVSWRGLRASEKKAALIVRDLYTKLHARTRPFIRNFGPRRK